jgi:hypothetical protein
LFFGTSTSISQHLQAPLERKESLRPILGVEQQRVAPFRRQPIEAKLSFSANP